MIEIKMLPLAGQFGENKDIARKIRLEQILPSLEKGEEIVLDFQGMEAATQSFIHALISDIIRMYGINILDKLYFKNCNPTVSKIISIVVDYMQDNIEEDSKSNGSR